MSRSEASSWVTRRGGEVPVRDSRRVVRLVRGWVRDVGSLEREPGSGSGGLRAARRRA